MTKKQKKMRNRIVVTAILFAGLTIGEKLLGLGSLPVYALALFYAVPYLIIGYDVIRKAAINISHGQVFDENFLMMIATFAAFAIGEYDEALAVMLFYQIGELFQGYAVGKSRQSITEMMSIAPEYANLETDNGLEEVDPDDVELGSIIVVKPGEKIPLDGVVVEGDSFVDTAALTGESVPRHVGVEDDVISGCVNGEGTLRIRTTKVYDDSTVAKILELVENASSKKARLENFITRFAKYYTPVVTIGALLLAVLPPLVLGGGALVWFNWIKRACIFLIVSCPCALVISVPLGFFGGIGASSKLGVLVKGSNYLEAISQMTTVVMDKTGTLTKGNFVVSQIYPAGETSRETLLELAAYGEAYSNHPIAKSIASAYGKEVEISRLLEHKEVPGHGIEVLLDGEKLLVGNAKLLKLHGISFEECFDVGTVVYVSYNGIFAGSLVISDEVKSGAKEGISQMKAAGIKTTIMLTGDRTSTAEAVAKELGIDEVRSELLPGDKVDAMEEIMSQNAEGKVGFVGDGINDAPVLMRADVGIAMGSLGSDAAIEAADIVIMDDDIRKISDVVFIAKKTLRIVKENIWFAIGVKVLVLVLGAFGIANMWEAVFADVGVAVIAILNSMRALNYKK